MIDEERFLDNVFAKLFPPPNPYLLDPAGWIEDEMGEEVWSGQREICDAVTEHKRTAVRACHGPGKTRIVSRLALHWIDVWPPGTAKVVTTAPSFWQVRGLVWSEMLRGHKKGKEPPEGEIERRPMRGRISIASICEWMLDGDWVAEGRKPPDPAAGTEDETIKTLQGVHADNLLIIVDEACGVVQQLWMALDSLMTTGNCHIVAIGNPDDPDTRFAELFKPESKWHQIHIPLARLPAFQGGRVEIPLYTGPTYPVEKVSPELYSKLPDEEYLQDFIDEWGIDGNAYQSKILAEFPQSSKDGVIAYASLNRCLQVEREADPKDMIQMGWDVAADGDDENVLTELQSSVFVAQHAWRKEEPMESVGHVVSLIREARTRVLETRLGTRIRVKVDAAGVGWGVAGRLREVMREKRWFDVEIIDVNVSERASDAEKYLNQRAEMWWMGRDCIRDQVWDIRALDSKCQADLLAPKWKKTSNGKIQIEDKDEVKKRLKRSPDRGESALLAAFDPPPEEGSVSVGSYNRTTAKGRR